MIADETEEIIIARIANAIGEPARTRILYSLLDGHARTSTELAVVAEVTPPTASVHLQRLMTEGLITVDAQGKHRYFRLTGGNVARALEALSLLAGKTRKKFIPNTPSELRFARTCYDHMAGKASVLLHNRFRELKWLRDSSSNGKHAYELSREGTKAFSTLGIDLDAASALRRRFAYPCLDWSERQPHIGGSFAAAFLQVALKRKWVERDLTSRALEVTGYGKREILSRFGVRL
jgi:DNA-binding transcriptional ArsR family regulator